MASHLVFCACLGLAVIAAAQQPASVSPRLQAAAHAVAGRCFTAHPEGLADLFAPEFLAQVPASKLQSLCSTLYGQLGSVSSISLAQAKSASAAVFTFHFSQGATAPVTLAVKDQPSHNIVGLLIGPPVAGARDYAALVAQLKALPGQVSFAAERLETGGAAHAQEASHALASYQPQQELAIGSAFKLYVLGTLARQTAAGQRRWNQVVPLTTHSFPGGQLQKWPLGSPLTLQTLAALMISNSDNTAADELLRTLGPARVEAMQKTMGHSQPSRNQPFLTTLEMFQIKYGPGSLRQQYLAATPAARRALLAKLPVVGAPDQLPELAAGAAAPRDINTLEWFASAADLCRALAWFQAPARKTARALLAINPGLSLPASRWRYVGYKGGSEPGVLSLNFLLEDRGGHWFAVSLIWNNPQAAVDEAKLLSLASRAIALLPGQ